MHNSSIVVLLMNNPQKSTAQNDTPPPSQAPDIFNNSQPTPLLNSMITLPNRMSPHIDGIHYDAKIGATTYVSGQFDDAPEDCASTSITNLHHDYMVIEQISTSAASALWHQHYEVTEKQTVVPRTQITNSIASSTTTRETEAPFSGISQQTKGITSLADCDVLCGRGGKSNNHNGNREYRLLVDIHRDEYFVARKPRKAEISQAIVRGIRARGGRFLKHDKKSNTWYDVGDTKAVEKTSQALREGAAKKLREILSRNSPKELDCSSSPLYPDAHVSAQIIHANSQPFVPVHEEPQSWCSSSVGAILQSAAEARSASLECRRLNPGGDTDVEKLQEIEIEKQFYSAVQESVQKRRRIEGETEHAGELSSSVKRTKHSSAA